jgi:hypothetical protein
MKKLLTLYLLTAVLLSGCATKSLSSNSLPNVTQTDTSVILPEISYSTIESKTTLVITEPDTTETTAIKTNPTKAETETIIDDGQLVRILDYIPDVVVDLRYATTNNFTGTVIYDDSEAYLCYGTVKKLIQVQNELKEKGYRLLIWDAYRSPEAQWKLWETYPDPTFVANPNNGITNHSRGNTIDISMVYEDGSYVEMPSAFDEFSTIADRDYSDVPDDAAINAMLLEDVMYRNGFTGYRGEWWDYSDINSYD